MPYDIIVGRNKSDKKRFGKKGLIYIGKNYVKMGQLDSLSNPILMDVARSHVVLVAGKRGSGKSYTLGAIAEELSQLPEESAENIASLIFDTMGIFWTMQHKNDKEPELLREWQLESKKLPARVFIPYGFFQEYKKRGIAGNSFALSASELSIDDWILTFSLDFLSPAAIIIARVITSLKEKEKNYSILKIMQEIEKSDVDEKDKRAAISLFEAARTWGVFAEGKIKPTLTTELVKAGSTSILDLSCYSSLASFNVRALVIGLVSKKLFTERMDARKAEEVKAVQHGIDYLYYSEKREFPLVWIFIDEAHEFLPQDSRTAATGTLIQLLREGRQPGISMVLATQQPGKIHTDVMTQSDIVISHRVTSRPDTEALNNIMQSYLLEDIKTSLDNLPDLPGSAILLDDNSEHIYPMRVRPRFTWHGGEAPTAIKIEERE